MAAEAYFLGLDINAYGLAFSLHDNKANAIAGLRRSFGEQSGPGEHDPTDWWRAVRTGVKELFRRAGVKTSAIRSIGLTGMSQGCVALDKADQVLFPALIGNSDKLSPFAEQLVSMLGARNFANLTGSGKLVSAGYMAPKLLAIKETAPRVWHDLHHVLSPRDYLRMRLSGKHVTDPSMASRSLLYSPRNSTWSPQVLERLGIDVSVMPQVALGNRLSARVSEIAGKETSLPAGTPIVTGGCHQACAAIAMGASHPGDISIELGSTGSIYALTDEPKRDLQGAMNLRNHCLEGLWAFQADHPASGASLEWFMKNIVPSDVQQARRAKKDPLDHFCELAADSSPGSNGVHWLPFGTGTGSLIGVNSQTSKGDVARALFEGTSLAIAESVSHCQRLGCEPQRVMLSGSGAKSNLWPQIVADALNLEVSTVDLPHLCARGAAVLAAVASGAIKSIDKAVNGQLDISATYQPRPAAAEVYQELMPLRARLRESLETAQTDD